MSSKKKKNQPGGQMPASSAGLLRFFEDETPGIKIRPEFVMAFAISLIAASIFLIIFLPT